MTPLTNRTDQSREPNALSEEELRAQDAEPLPGREVMTTLLWAPMPHVAVQAEELVDLDR